MEQPTSRKCQVLTSEQGLFGGSEKQNPGAKFQVLILVVGTRQVPEKVPSFGGKVPAV